ncbi:MAG TPA: hypothetical protein VGE01_11770 [Fimbriimonas sp.]
MILSVDTSGTEQIAAWFYSAAGVAAVLFAWVANEALTHGTKRVDRMAMMPAAVSVVGIAVYRPGLRLAFRANRSALDGWANQIERGGSSLATPRWVGPFLIRRAVMRYGSYPALTLDPDPTGPTALVRSDRIPGNEWSSIRLSEDWLLYSED